jgi:2'-5' RNA ligase
MRLFFAFELDDGARAKVSHELDRLTRRLSRAREGRAVKWVERENLHVTLRFLGEVADPSAAALMDALSAPLRVAPFTMTLGGGGCFPPAGPPRVAWVGIRNGTDAAKAVYERLEERLTPLGFDREPRGYTPHVTLGRIREVTRQTGRELREWLGALPSPLADLLVREIVLYRSHLGPQGPRYELLRRTAMV